MSKSDRELLKAYPDAKRVRRVGNDAIWTMTLLDGRTADVRVSAMAGKLTAIKAARRCERMSSNEQGSALTPVIAILTVFSVGAALIAQSGLLHAVLARLAQVQ